jgi:hypothetical protein
VIGFFCCQAKSQTLPDFFQLIETQRLAKSQTLSGFFRIDLQLGSVATMLLIFHDIEACQPCPRCHISVDNQTSILLQDITCVLYAAHQGVKVLAYYIIVCHIILLFVCDFPVHVRLSPHVPFVKRRPGLPMSY